MSDYSPLKLRKLWEEFQEYAALGSREGLAIYLHNDREFETLDMFSSASLIHKRPKDLDLKISRTITY